MQIVIETPEEEYNALMEMPTDFGILLYKIIREGIVLPEHHGRLIDVDSRIEELTDLKNRVEMSMACVDNQREEDWVMHSLDVLHESIKFLKESPVVVEATKEDK